MHLNSRKKESRKPDVRLESKQTRCIYNQDRVLFLFFVLYFFPFFDFFSFLFNSLHFSSLIYTTIMHHIKCNLKIKTARGHEIHIYVTIICRVLLQMKNKCFNILRPSGCLSISIKGYKIFCFGVLRLYYLLLFIINNFFIQLKKTFWYDNNFSMSSPSCWGVILCVFLKMLGQNS